MKAENNEVFFEISAKHTNLGIIRDVVRSYLDSEKIVQKEKGLIVSAVDELATNVVEHAYKNRNLDTEFIKIFLAVKDNKVEISVEDEGDGIDKNNKSKEEGGMGLIIAKKIVDEFNVEEKSKGVKIKIIKTINKEG